MREFDYDKLINAIPIRKGQTLDIVSDLFNIVKKCMALKLKFDPNHLIDAFCSAVGEEGTILIRTFSWDFCHGLGFDIKRTASSVGALGNVAMRRKDFRRTKHPIYSWMVWGKSQECLCNLDEKEAFGENSVFAWEAKNDQAMQILVGSPAKNGITLFHYMEEVVGVSYRYIKNFTDTYVDENNNSSIKTYSMYVRDLDYEIITDDAVYIPFLEEREIKINGSFMDISIESYKIKELCQVYENDFRKNTIPTGVTLKPIKKIDQLERIK